MHDLMYDLARVVIGEELIVYNANKLRSPADRKYCRYARLTNSSTPLLMPTNLPAKLRALIFHDCSQLDIHGGAFSFAKCLRVLDLSESSFSKFPSSIGYLKQLRFLIAPGMKTRRFPVSIAGLSKLQYLDIHGSSQILAIPESIGKLDCIMHLDLSGCTKIVYLPESFGNLKKLLHLELSSCSSLERIPASTCGLTSLQYLNLSGCSNLQRLPRDIGSLIELQYFSISICSKIKQLPVSFGKLKNLVHLDLSRCSFGITKSLGGLTKLKYLNLSQSLNNDNRGAENIINYIRTLTELEHLDLSGNLFPSLPECIGDLKRLHTLDLSGCRNLEFLPKSIGSIDSLELLLVNECSETLKDYIRQSGLKCNPLARLVVRQYSDYSTNLHELEGMNPADLEISGLENIRYSGEATQIELCNKENLSKLTLQWTREAGQTDWNDNFILGELVPPSGLKYLELHGYSSPSFPNWFMGISHSLPNLVNLKLKDIKWCSNLPPLGQLPNLKELHLIKLSSIEIISEDFCGGKGAFRRLSTFSLQHMDGLYEWNTLYCGEDGTEEFMFPVLDELVMFNCPMLRLKPCPPTFQKWKITSCDKVLHSWEGGDNFSHLKFSSAPRTKLLLSFYYWRYNFDCSWSLLKHLPTLQELEMIDAAHNWLTSLPESMRQLSSLRFLGLYRCAELKMLPDWLGELKSLESIRIVQCVKIKSLPSSIQQLTNLQKLRIGRSRYLRQWCESDENKVKLAHIKDIIYEDCDTTTYDAKSSFSLMRSPSLQLQEQLETQFL